jgi:hypothetical protein
MELLSEALYLVQSEQDDTVLLAMDLNCSEELVEWFDSSRDRAFEVVSIKQSDEILIVQTDAAEYRFRYMSLDAYRAHAQDKLVGQPLFKSTPELQAYYRNFVR